MKRATRRFGPIVIVSSQFIRLLASLYSQLSAAAIQIPVMNEMMQEMKMVPRRPKNLFRGALDQHPMRQEQR